MIRHGTPPHLSDLKLVCHGDDYQVDRDWDCGACVVPAGFVTDGASIPWVFWALLGSPFSPRLMRAATAHDYLYREGLDAGDYHFDYKDFADWVFYKFLLLAGVASWRAKLMHWGVQRFGGFFYRGHR